MFIKLNLKLIKLKFKRCLLELPARPRTRQGAHAARGTAGGARPGHGGHGAWPRHDGHGARPGGTAARDGGARARQGGGAGRGQGGAQLGARGAAAGEGALGR
jgi:hypothetical protein